LRGGASKGKIVRTKTVSWNAFSLGRGGEEKKMGTYWGFKGRTVNRRTTRRSHSSETQQGKQSLWDETLFGPKNGRKKPGGGGRETGGGGGGGVGGGGGGGGDNTAGPTGGGGGGGTPPATKKKDT